MQHKTIKSQRGITHYWITRNQNKSAKCVVFCHGLTADHTLFDKQVDFWSRNYSVIVWDIPLHGKSRPYIDFTLFHATEELNTILTTENINQCILMGQSAGGFVCQVFIKNYPDRVQAFIGIDTTPLGMEFYKRNVLFWLKHFGAIARLYPYKYYCKVSSESATYTDESRESFYKTLLELGKQGMLEATKGVYGDFMNYENTVDILCPVLLLIGEHDKIGYVKRYNKKWAQETGFPLIVIKNAAHNSNYDNYEEFNYIVNEFLERKRNYR